MKHGFSDFEKMTHKTAYIWGPVSSFTGPLIAWLLQKDWQVHLAVKPALDLFTLAPLDLHSSAQALVERALGGHEKLRTFQDRLRFVEPHEIGRGTKYDALIFCGLPPNFDEPRVPRAPWAASELAAIAKVLKGVPTFIVSSLWGAVQPDGVVPEEFEFDRRKALTHWENVCQQYENRLLKGLALLESPWHLVRLPLLSGKEQDGAALNFSGLFTLLHHVYQAAQQSVEPLNALKLNYNPDSTLWFLPVDKAVYLFWRLLEDEARPRICNLVSTQAMLNREWLHYMASAVGYKTTEAGESDAFDLPGILRKLLKDNVQVKTRNLFEVAARYYQSPVSLDSDYFQKMLSFAKGQNWGEFEKPVSEKLVFSEDLADHYFKEFLPQRMAGKLVKEFTRDDTTVGFFLLDGDWSYLLKASNGTPMVSRLDPDGDHPSVRIRFTSQTMTRLIQNKVSLPEAVLRGQVKIEGAVLDTLRVGNALGQFLKENPYK